MSSLNDKLNELINHQPSSFANNSPQQIESTFLLSNVNSNSDLIKQQLQLEAIKLIQISLDKLTNTKYLYKNSQNLCKNLLINRLLNKSKLYYYQTIVQTIRYSIYSKLGYYINLIQKNNYSESCVKDIIKQLIENLLSNNNDPTTTSLITTTTATNRNDGDDENLVVVESSSSTSLKRKSIDDDDDGDHDSQPPQIDENNNTINNNTNKRVKLTDLSNSTTTEHGHTLVAC